MWFIEEADRKGNLEVMNLSSQGINESLSRWKKEIERTTAVKKKKEACPLQTGTTVRLLHPEAERGRWTKAHRHHLKDNVYRLMQTATRQDRQGWRMKMRVRKLQIISDSAPSQATAVRFVLAKMEQVLEALLWEALWP